MIVEAHTYDSPGGLEAGVWPERVDIRGHFQLVGANRRALVVGDMGGLIDIGGVHVYDPDHLDEMAARLTRLATRLRERTAA